MKFFTMPLMWLRYATLATLVGTSWLLTKTNGNETILAGLFVVAFIGIVAGDLLDRLTIPPLVGLLIIAGLIGAGLIPIPDQLSKGHEGWPVLIAFAQLAIYGKYFEGGLNLDLNVLWDEPKRVLAYALSSIVLPWIFVLGAGWLVLKTEVVPIEWVPEGYRNWTFVVLMGFVVSVSPLALHIKLLQETKLFSLPFASVTIGYQALNELISWVMFSLFLTYLETEQFNTGMMVVRMLAIFGLVSFILVAVRRKGDSISLLLEKQELDEAAVTLAVISGTIVFSMVMEVLLHAGITAAILSGIVCGNITILRRAAESRAVEVFSHLFLVLYFVSVGMEIDIWGGEELSWEVMLGVILLSILPPFVSVLLPAMKLEGGIRRAYPFALSASTVGVSALVVLSQAIKFSLMENLQQIFVGIFAAIILSVIWTSSGLKQRFKESTELMLSNGGFIPIEFVNKPDSDRLKLTLVKLFKVLALDVDRLKGANLDRIASSLVVRQIQQDYGTGGRVPVLRMKIKGIKEARLYLLYNIEVFKLFLPGKYGRNWMLSYLALYISPTQVTIDDQRISFIDRILNQRETKEALDQIILRGDQEEVPGKIQTCLSEFDHTSSTDEKKEE